MLAMYHTAEEAIARCAEYTGYRGPVLERQDGIQRDVARLQDLRAKTLAVLGQFDEVSVHLAVCWSIGYSLRQAARECDIHESKARRLFAKCWPKITKRLRDVGVLHALE